MSELKSETVLDEQTCKLICPISAAMIGVCLTTIGLIMFLVATLASYTALRTQTAVRMHRLERVADLFFIASMVLLAAICVFITCAIGTL